MFRKLAIFLAIGVTVARASDKPTPEDPGLVVFRDRCMACHLQTGMGIREMNAPSIAGLPRWYVADQLRKFRRDQRGFHEDDDSGHLMQANAAALDERSIAFVGRHIENLPANEKRLTLDIRISHTSKSLYLKHCGECHGPRAEGQRGDRVPPLTNQQDWYLLRQMENFKTGKRVHADGVFDPLSAEEINAVVAWVARLSSDN